MTQTIRAFLAVNCPMDGLVKFDRCKRCMFNEYESLIEYAVDCSFIRNKEKEVTKVNCEDFGKVNIDTDKCAMWNEDTKQYDICPVIVSCAMEADVWTG